MWNRSGRKWWGFSTEIFNITQKKKRSLIIGLIAAAFAFAACNNVKQDKQGPVQPQGLVIEKQGVFSSGGRVTDPIPGEYDVTQNWLDMSRKGTTTHVDHDVIFNWLEKHNLK